MADGMLDVLTRGNWNTPDLSKSRRLVMPERGAAGTRERRDWPGNEEYNRTLAGMRGLRVFDKMRRSDSTVAASLRLVKTPVLAASWFVEAPDPEDEEGMEIREFVEWNLFEALENGWMQFLSDCLTMMDFGYSFFEKLYANEMTPWGTRTVLREFAPRSPLDVIRWHYDMHGRPVEVEMQGWEGGYVKIPIDRFAVFTYQKEVGNLEGISVLRSSYKNWFFKDVHLKIDAIQKEKHSIGVPVMKMPYHWSKDDHEAAVVLCENLRTSEKAYGIISPGWELEFVKIEGQPVNPLESVEYHDKAIMRNVIGDFMYAGGATNTKYQQELFLKSGRFVADIIRGVLNNQVIPQLVRYNWSSRVKDFPKVMVRRIAEEEALRTYAFLYRNLVQAGIIVPDDKLEEHIRKEVYAPAKDESSERMDLLMGGMGDGATGMDRNGGGSGPEA